MCASQMVRKLPAHSEQPDPHISPREEQGEGVEWYSEESVVGDDRESIDAVELQGLESAEEAEGALAGLGFGRPLGFPRTAETVRCDRNGLHLVSGR